jgi:ubiquinone/menaquinone biosynthesis C-methylase UbiE
MLADRAGGGGPRRNLRATSPRARFPGLASVLAMEDTMEGYAPGFAEDAISMMASRTAESRVAFFLRALAPGMRVLDAGCGPGAITLGLARSVSPRGSCVGVDREPSQIVLAHEAAARAGLSGVAFEVASIYDLPFADGSFDGVLSHAVFEHLARPAAALGELRRVLRSGGVLGVCSSDWGGAKIEPRGEDVELALRCHLLLRRKAGGDPYAGEWLPAAVEAAGFVDADVTREHHVDMSYRAFARYIGWRIEAAARESLARERHELLAGAEAARRWAQGEDGHLSQPWTAVLARKL